MSNRKSKAGAAADCSTKDENMFVCQHSRKPNVACWLSSVNWFDVSIVCMVLNWSLLCIYFITKSNVVAVLFIADAAVWFLSVVLHILLDILCLRPVSISSMFRSLRIRFRSSMYLSHKRS
jgi:hypothetical protein